MAAVRDAWSRVQSRTAPVTFTVERSILFSLRKLAEVKGVSLSATVRACVKQGLKELMESEFQK